ncbi:MAG TPA: hypothetical protein PK772_08295 [Chitinophagaceae bacterium]|nr:hypothetical protein [Chitinophagaceae bacterium]
MKTENTYLKNKEKNNYELVEQEFLQHYTFKRSDLKWHMTVYMDGNNLGDIRIAEYLDCLVHTIKKSNQFIHINLQKFIEEIQLHMQQHINDPKEPASWRMEGNVFIHALKEILLLREEADIETNMSDTFLAFSNMYEELLRINNESNFNITPIFNFKMVWGY